MLPKLPELLDALPDDDAAAESLETPQAIEQLLQTTHRPVPVGSLRRLWSVGGLKARIAFAYLAYWLRTYFRERDEKERQLMETHLKAAVKLLSTMSYLRGAVMKVGQFLATVPDIAPDEFVETLAALHFEAPPMHYSLLREYLSDELGGDPEEVFASFDRVAFAAASLGQVHRARLKSGEDVAVKVQYPGIANTIRADMRNLRALLFPLRLTKDWENLRDQVTELHEVFLAETDYEAEARHLAAARAVFDPEEGILIPRVYREHSTARVLTMEYVDGKSFYDFLATRPSQTLRDQFGEKMYRTNCALMGRANLHYADVHPGNYLFLEDGRLGCVDFGCVRHIDDEQWKHLDRMARAVHGGYEEERDYVREACLMSEEEMSADKEYVDLIVSACHWSWKPWRHEGTFDFGDIAYLRHGLDLYARTTRTGKIRLAPLLVFYNRSLFAGIGLFQRLGARIDARKIHEEESALRPGA